MLNARWFAVMSSMALVVLGTATGHTQNYPTKPIRVLTSEIGGGSDFTARQVTQAIAGPLGQPVIVDNGVMLISTESVGKAAPDGYTLLVTGPSFWVGPLFFKTNYDPIKNFAPVSLLVNSPNILVVHPSVPAKSVKQLIDLARAKPGALNYASSAVGASGHLAAELFKYMAKVDIVHIPYKGSGPANIALIGGQVQLAFATPGSVTPHIKSGKLRALAVTSAQPSALMPDLPAVAATVPDYESGGATAMLAPAGTPPAIIARLNREIVHALSQPEVKERFLKVGVEPVASSPEQLAAAIKSEMTRLGTLVKEAGLKLE